jgi:hypothetical protein
VSGKHFERCWRIGGRSRLIWRSVAEVGSCTEARPLGASGGARPPGAPAVSVPCGHKLIVSSKDAHPVIRNGMHASATGEGGWDATSRRVGGERVRNGCLSSPSAVGANVSACLSQSASFLPMQVRMSEAAGAMAMKRF